MHNLALLPFLFTSRQREGVKRETGGLEGVGMQNIAGFFFCIFITQPDRLANFGGMFAVPKPPTLCHYQLLEAKAARLKSGFNRVNTKSVK